MLGRTHQIIGVTAGLALYLFAFPHQYSPATFATALVAAHFAALLPDIDQPASTFWRSLPAGRVAGEMANPFLQHRNLTHSILGAAIVAVLLRTLFHHFPVYWGINGHEVLIVSLTAYLSHLLADMVTVEGIPLLFPSQHMFGLPPKPFAGLRIETGHWFENFIVFPTVNVLLLFLVYSNWHTIRLIIFHS